MQGRGALALRLRLLVVILKACHLQLTKYIQKITRNKCITLKEGIFLNGSMIS
jgi:hypothetical protein